VSSEKVDELKLGGAWKYAIRRVIDALVNKVKQAHPEVELRKVVLDGNKTVDQTSLPIEPVPRADRLYAGVSAASILAKFSRDHYMKERAPHYPEFYEIFSKGHGYRHTAKHRELLEAGKFTDMHRQSYDPLKSLLHKGLVVHKVTKRPPSPVTVLTLHGPEEVNPDATAQ
jgi:ribonuclease HII